MAITAEQIAEGLEAKRSGRNRWMARCPAHDDRTPSLQISEKRDGRPLVHCFAGCDFRDIVKELEAMGLWEQTDRPPGPPPKKIEWAKWFVRIYEADVAAQRTICEQDLAEYRKAQAILREAKEVGRD